MFPEFFIGSIHPAQITGFTILYPDKADIRKLLIQRIIHLYAYQVMTLSGEPETVLVRCTDKIAQQKGDGSFPGSIIKKPEAFINPGNRFLTGLNGDHFPYDTQDMRFS